MNLSLAALTTAVFSRSLVSTDQEYAERRITELSTQFGGPKFKHILSQLNGDETVAGGAVAAADAIAAVLLKRRAANPRKVRSEADLDEAIARLKEKYENAHNAYEAALLAKATHHKNIDEAEANEAPVVILEEEEEVPAPTETKNERKARLARERRAAAKANA